MSYAAPQDEVAYEEDFADASKLLARGSGYSAYVLNRVQFGTPAHPTNAAAYVPKCWTRFGALAGPGYQPWPGQPYGAIVFLHERTSPAGNRRLVVVRYFPEARSFTGQFFPGFNYEARAIIPATLKQPPSYTSFGFAYSIASGTPRVPPNVRMYSGLADPNDASHFTIRYEMWGMSDVLDGYLDDRDVVTLKPRKMLREPSLRRLQGAN
jgi:hypothetical protein